MNVFDKARIIIYRFHEKGLEVMLVNPELDADPKVWKLPDGTTRERLMSNPESMIELDPVHGANGESIQTFAIEADWQEVPSVRGIIKHDVKRVKSKIKEVLPGVEKGTYFAVKEAFKKVLPDEYNALKELKDILLDRNLVTNI